MITVGICGLGAIGMRVAEALDRGGVEGMRLAAVSARDVARAEARLAALAAAPPVVAAGRLAELAEVVV